MDNTTIAAPLLAALEAKGYSTLTPVQEAVLTPEAEGRDILVSAQTGSGKTAAFGIAIAPDLLAGAERFLFADVPLALIIAPTRELALQVARELDWLYAETGAKIATCVGGMDYRTEKRALERGAHIVVGTPGRLRDHIERRSLDLSGLRAAVLDEADEMLDLGFREDLEFILEQSPEDRRTLMFSATVPKAIAEIARDFQSDALRIQTAGEARQHVDIEYRALSVQVRDKEHAIFNLLRFYEAQTAIVFCKTRANVNHLLARMGNRGFQVVALSGELSQQERTNALSALRNGRARVCIATDVAARGIDLPGLELVIHADLPSNSDVLLHRSGRTGRAGAKGTSALMVVPAEFRKAQRLLQGAKVVAEWGTAPSADEVMAKDDQRIMEHPALGPNDGEHRALSVQLLERFGPEQVAAAFVTLWRQGRAAPEELSDVNAAPTPPRPRADFGASVWYRLSVGRAGRAEARWLLPKICEAGGITKDGIGAIRVQEDETFVQIGRDVAGKFGEETSLEEGVTMRRMEGEPAMDRPERSARPPREAPIAKPARMPRAPYERKPPRIVEDDAGSPGAPPQAPDATPAPTLDPTPPRTEARTERAAKAPYVKRDAPPREAGAKPYRPAKPPFPRRDDVPKTPHAPRSVGTKPYARPTGGAKPYARTDDPAKRAGGPGAKPYAKRADGAPRPAGGWAPRNDGPAGFATRPEGEAKKPRWKTGDRVTTPEGGKAAPRSAGFRSHGAVTDPGSRPARSAGSKSHKTEGKIFAKPGGGKFVKTVKTKAPASDTSKRFVPPGGKKKD